MSEGILHIVDSRTQKSYEIPIHRNTVRATDFQAIKAPEDGCDPADQVARGLRLYDPGYRNTAAMQSKIMYLHVLPFFLMAPHRSKPLQC